MLTEQQLNEFQEAAKPLVKWINDNCHPHTAVLVEQDSAELIEGIARVKIDEFIKD